MKIFNNLALNDVDHEFKVHQRFGIKAKIPTLTEGTQLSVRRDHDNTFRVTAAQLFNVLPVITALDKSKVGLDRFIEQCPDTPPVTGYTPLNDN